LPILKVYDPRADYLSKKKDLAIKPRLKMVKRSTVNAKETTSGYALMMYRKVVWILG
jgi:predicted secreted protein